jgi:hypothetical protein
MISMTRKLALVAGIGLALASVSYTPPASAQVYVNVGVAPPAPRYEVVPPPRVGYEWSAGYWRWDPRWHRHVWVPGTWIAARPGWHWHQGAWVGGPGGWRWHQGYWGR